MMSTIKHYILIFYFSAFRNNRRQTSFFHGHSRILYSVLTSTFLNSLAKNDFNSSIFLDFLFQLDILDRIDIKVMQFRPLCTLLFYHESSTYEYFLVKHFYRHMHEDHDVLLIWIPMNDTLSINFL